MWFWAAETKHVDVLAGDRANNLGSRDEDPAFWRQDHNVGEGGAVGRTASCWPKHDRNLRDST
jgi:hypothetical protein